MTKRDDGGFAFPSPDWNGDWNGPDANHGMTLRDWFAGQALAGIISKMDFYGVNPPKGSGATGLSVSERDEIMSAIADGAYNYADAMLEERKK